MSDDIVTRLRVLNHHAKKLAENESLHDLQREAFTRCENLTLEAADTITRLRARIAELETEDCNWIVGGGALQRFMEDPDG